MKVSVRVKMLVMTLTMKLLTLTLVGTVTSSDQQHLLGPGDDGGVKHNNHYQQPHNQYHQHQPQPQHQRHREEASEPQNEELQQHQHFHHQQFSQQQQQEQHQNHHHQEHEEQQKQQQQQQKESEKRQHEDRNLSPPVTTNPPEDDTQIINITELYAVSLNFSARFLSHVRPEPDSLDMIELRPQLRPLFHHLDPLALVSSYVEEWAAHVTTSHHAHALYNLLDLYSALEDVRQKYLQKVMKRFKYLEALNPIITGRDFNPFIYLVPAFARTITKIRKNITSFYRSTLEPRVGNINFLVHFQPGGQPKLQSMLLNLSLPTSPFMQMDERGYYYIRPADDPHYLLGVRPSDHHHHQLRVVNTTTTTNTMIPEEVNTHPDSYVFLFKPVRGRFGATQYQLTSASLPDTRHLVVSESGGPYPVTSDGAINLSNQLYFGTKKGGALDVLRLPSEEYILIHKTRTHRQVHFLTWSTSEGQVKVTSRYPGRGAHWLLQDTASVTQDTEDQVTQVMDENTNSIQVTGQIRQEDGDVDYSVTE